MKTRFADPKILKSAFSLIELFVLVAVIAVLASLFFASAFHRARQRSTESGCLNNLRRLTLGWQMYASDNHGILPANGDEGDEPSGAGTLFTEDPQWCPGRMDPGAGAGVPTNVAWIQAGQIYPYVGNTLYYRCPADVSTYFGGVVYPMGGKGNPRLRSYSMNGWVNPFASFITGGLGPAAANYRVYHQVSDLAVPGPANVFLLVDENPYSINDSLLYEAPTGGANPPRATEWIDVPAAWHGAGAGISFCDGHAQIRQWTDSHIIASKLFGIPASPPYTDLLWLLQHTTAHK